MATIVERVIALEKALNKFKERLDELDELKGRFIILRDEIDTNSKKEALDQETSRRKEKRRERS